MLEKLTREEFEPLIGQKFSVTAPEGGVTAYSYDALGRRITENPGTVRSGAVAVASEIHGEKGQGPGLEQHNWAFKKEDPFPKWEV